MIRRSAIAIDLGRRRLRALLAEREGGILRVKQVLMKDVPEQLDIDDVEQYGEWVSRSLAEAGFPKGKATIALAREHVGLKRIHLPTTDDAELPEMTRLAMQRELPFDAETAVIDFVPLKREQTSTTVLAVAVQQKVLDHAKAIARHAKLGVERISLRSMGSALILRYLGDDGSAEEVYPLERGDADRDLPPSRSAESILAVDITSDSIEFCVVENGCVRFSRAAEFGSGMHSELIVESVLTETRRTWMSYRIAEGTTEIRHAILMGDRQVCEEVAGPLTEMLRVKVEVLSGHPLVDSGGNEMARVWPLAGLLLESGHETQTIDFANPRKAPDLAAARRKRLFMVAALLLIVLLGLWTFATRDLAALERELAQLQSQQRTLLPEYARFNRDGMKLRHLQQWESVNVDWLEHLVMLGSMTNGTTIAGGAEGTPDGPTRAIVLDSWQGSQQFRGVRFDRRSSEWSAPMQISINVSGEARDRATADAFREKLVRTDVYATSSTGPDAAGGRRLPHGFAYRLRTDIGTFPEQEPDDVEDETHDGEERLTDEEHSRHIAGGTEP
jgi:Tfp pilus assembly PilM family ATPase